MDSRLTPGDILNVRFGVSAKRVTVASVSDDGHAFKTTDGESYIAPDVTTVVRKAPSEHAAQPTVHKLPSTAEGVRAARDLCDAINGDIIYVPPEGVIGVVYRGTAVAFTNERGDFTSLTAVRSVRFMRPPYRAGFDLACRMAAIVDRVARGARWLDVHYPGWFATIDLSLCDNDKDEWDIVRSATGNAVGWRDLEEARGMQWLIVCGFSVYNIGDYGSVYTYVELGEIWRDVIAARRADRVARNA